MPEDESFEARVERETDRRYEEARAAAHAENLRTFRYVEFPDRDAIQRKVEQELREVDAEAEAEAERRRREELKDEQLELHVRALRQQLAEEPPAARQVDGRVERWRIPIPSFWYVVEQRVKKGDLAKVNSLSEHTRRNPELPFVGRGRVGKLVTWVDEHPDQAREALRLHAIPAGFRATQDGVLVPE